MKKIDDGGLKEQTLNIERPTPKAFARRGGQAERALNVEGRGWS